MHMDSEKIDWISECGVGRRDGVALSDIFKAVFLKRIGKVRDSSKMDCTELIERHNRVFGIDSNLPDAAMRYDLRKTPPVSSVELPAEVEVRFTPTPRVETITVPAVVTPVVVVPDIVPTSDGESASMAAGSYSTDSPINIGDYIPGTDVSSDAAAAETEFFPDVRASDSITKEPVACGHVEIDIEGDAEELTDVAAEDIAGYVEAEIARELVQTTIDNPAFEAPEGCETPDPALTRQSTLEIDYETIIAGIVVEDSIATESVAVPPAEAGGEAADAEDDMPVELEDGISTELETDTVAEAPAVEAVVDAIAVPLLTEASIEAEPATSVEPVPEAGAMAEGAVVVEAPVALEEGISTELETEASTAVPAAEVLTEAVEEPLPIGIPIEAEFTRSVEPVTGAMEEGVVEAPVAPVAKPRRSSGITFGFGCASVSATPVTGVRFAFGIASE